MLSLRRITWDKMKSWLLVLALATSSSSGQQFHEPNSGVPAAVPGTPPLARGPSPKRHHHQVGKKKENCSRNVTNQDIHLDLDKEREHIKAQVKNDYIDTEKMDDNSLLMQYFRSVLPKSCHATLKQILRSSTFLSGSQADI